MVSLMFNVVISWLICLVSLNLIPFIDQYEEKGCSIFVVVDSILKHVYFQLILSWYHDMVIISIERVSRLDFMMLKYIVGEVLV